jgi:acyl transferase domain-containing protein
MHVDPQHRILLEVDWEAMEDAGLPAGSVARTKTGVYVGLVVVMATITGMVYGTFIA